MAPNNESDATFVSPFLNSFAATPEVSEDEANSDSSTSAVAAPAQAAPGAAFGLIFQAPDPDAVVVRRDKPTRSTETDADDDDSTDEGREDTRGRSGRGGAKRSRGSKSGDRHEDETEADSSRHDEHSDGPDVDRDVEDAANSEVSADDDDADDERTPRRRRRGGRGRRGKAGSDEANGSARGGRDGDDSARDESRSDDHGEESSDDDDSDDSSWDDNSADDSEGSSRRRTRRRRRGTSSSQSNADSDDPNTVVKVREPRRAKDEVTSIKGSTRLEAKKQRRREGREAGRRRTVITEAEFLARRESVERVMVVREQQGRTQIGVLEDGVLAEHYVSRQEQAASMAGNVYLGRVQNVLPSMEAAFVDIGRGRNAVLYAGEVNWDAAGLDNQPKRIEHALKAGESVLVQVTKDPIGHKGARLTSQVSLPGRFLVYVPGNSMTGISRKLPDTERARLKKILKEVVPADAGVIVRTAAEGASEEELRADVERLARMWESIQKKAESQNAPSLLHGEPDLTVRVIRDVFNEDFSKMVVSGERAWNEVHSYISDVAPDLVARLEKYEGEADVFAQHRIDEQLAKAMDRKVWLPSGGSLVIDRTEAMTVIDVNTGKFVGSGGNLEETVTKNNIEAAEEIVRQLRLRDVGGIIVIDLIDMVLESNRELVVRRLLECLGRDRTKHQVAEVTSLGLVQMTRKRVGSGLVEVFSEPCEHCNGRGIIIHDRPVENRDINGNDTRKGRGRKNRDNATSNGSGANNNSQDKRSERPEKDNGFAQIAAAAHAAAVSASDKSQKVSQADELEAQVVDVKETSAGAEVTLSVEPASATPSRESSTASGADESVSAQDSSAGADDSAQVDSSAPLLASAHTGSVKDRPRRTDVTGRIVPKAALLAAAAAGAEDAPLPSEDDDAPAAVAASSETPLTGAQAAVDTVREEKPKRRRRAATSAGSPTTAGQASVMTMAGDATPATSDAGRTEAARVDGDSASTVTAGDKLGSGFAMSVDEASTVGESSGESAAKAAPKKTRRRAATSAGAPVNLAPVDLSAPITTAAPLTTLAAESGQGASAPTETVTETATAVSASHSTAKPARKKRTRVVAAAGAPGVAEAVVVDAGASSHTSASSADDVENQGQNDEG